MNSFNTILTDTVSLVGGNPVRKIKKLVNFIFILKGETDNIGHSIRRNHTLALALIYRRLYCNQLSVRLRFGKTIISHKGSHFRPPSRKASELSLIHFLPVLLCRIRKNFRINISGLIQLLDIFQTFFIIPADGINFHLSVFLMIIAGINAKHRINGGKIVIPHSVGIIFPILIRIILGKCSENLRKFIPGFRHLQTQVLQPVFPEV